MRNGPLAKSVMFYIFQEKISEENKIFTCVKSVLYKYLCLFYCYLYFYMFGIFCEYKFLESILTNNITPIKSQFYKYATNCYVYLSNKSIKYG